jgi:colicin import membrane protein
MDTTVIEQAPAILNEREFDRGLWRMVLVSGALHAVAIMLVLLVPYSIMHRPLPLTSYTVDLVGADKVGGTNLVPGGKGRVESPPLVAARPEPKVEPPKIAKAEPPSDAKPPEVKPPEPQKVEPQPPKQVASKPEPQPPPVEVKPAEAPKAPQAKAEAKPKEEAVVAQKVEKVVPPAPPSPPKAAAAPKPEPPKSAVAAASKNAAAKADAAAAKKAAEAAAAHERDERILAAVRRVEHQTGARGGGTAQKAGDKPGGPVSVGPGQGAGGQFMGLEYILYYNALRTRLRDNWAWAGTDAKLEAVVRFGITETGDVVGVRITQSSGDASFDNSVERAVKAINPMPPPPEAHRKEFADVEWTFNLREMQE